MKAVIMAGGKGTRLSGITGDAIPKPMIPLCGKPLLQHQLEWLKANGVDEITLVVGYLGEKIREYFSDGSRLGVKLDYFTEENPLGSAGALRFLKEALREDFLLLFGDLVMDFSLRRMIEAHSGSTAAATLIAHPNSHPYDSDLVETNPEGFVTGFGYKHSARSGDYRNLVNAGVYLLTPRALDYLPDTERADFEKDVLSGLISGGERVYAYITPEYIKDAGTPDRLDCVREDMLSGIVSGRNLDKPQRCVFLDRDGTLNCLAGHISHPEQLELEVGVAQAIGALNRSAYLAIAVTNQPVVARGECSIEDIATIHNRLETLLGNEGAYLNAIYFCPHHPDKGFVGENPAYKRSCDCRKPATGLIDSCVTRYNIDKARSWMVGDTTVDIQTAKNAGLRCVLVRTGEKGLDAKFDARPDFICDNLPGAVELILAER